MDMETLVLRLAFVLYLFAFVFYTLHALRKAEARIAGRVVLFFAVLLQLAALAIRWVQSGHPPYRTLYESLVTLTWFIGLVLLVFELKTRDVRPLPVALFLNLIALYFTEFVVSPEMAPLSPALQSYWFFIHVPTMLLSYAFFTLAFSADLGQRIFPGSDPSGEANHARAAILIGLPILGTGIMMGSAWANEAWGRYWAWDPKEVWSLITFLGYMMYLHISIHPDLRKRWAFPMNAVAYLFVLLTYIGVNYITKIFSVESLHTF